MKNCPTCQCDQMKKASLIHAEGTGTSIGIGITTAGIGAGVGVSASALAVACTPPKKEKDAFMKKTGSWLLLIFFVPFMIVTFASNTFSEVGLFWKAWAGLGLILFVWLSYKFEQANEAHFQTVKADYEKTYMCLRCGNFYKPFD